MAPPVKKQSLKHLEEELKQYQEQLEEVIGLPDTPELQEIKSELQDWIAEKEAQIANATASADTKVDSASPVLPPQPPPTEEKWSREKHPAFQPGYRRPGAPSTPPPPEPQAPVTFNVNDMVLAKWVSGDKAFYPAKITSVTGSSANPIYSVTFKGYDNTDSVRKADLKPIDKKRKFDPPSASVASTAPSTDTSVISAKANVNRELANQAKAEPSKVSDGPMRPAKIPKKVKANKELEESKSKWQEFTKKGKAGKAVKKDSMFRLGDGINARVGFTGSGHAMRKDPVRTKHIYKSGEVDE